MRSLRSRLLVLWALSLAASVAVGLLLVQLYRQSSSAETSRAEAALSQACDAIGDRYAYFATGWAGPQPGAPSGGVDAGLRRDLAAVVTSALAPLAGIDGGMWQRDAGTIAPPQPGAPDAAAPDAAWQAAIATLAAEVARDDQAASRSIASGGTTVLLRACPLSGPIQGLVGWTLTRVPSAPGYGELRLGVGVLLALVLLTSLWLTVVIATYTRRIHAIEAALAGYEAGTLPHVELTGERDLDRIVAALNRAGARLAQAQARSAALSARVAAAERLAALGRVAAGVAHEIRNPIAAMRLRAENALAGDAARGRVALEAILGQIARLDRLIAELLDMTRAREPAPAPANIAALLRACAAEHADSATRVGLDVDSPESEVVVDSTLLRRALDNLVQNALRHAPPGSRVTLRAERAGDRLRIQVIDHGPGVPEALRAHLFEPFVTGHAEGTGLGLAIAREMAQAQGGSLSLTSPAAPTIFPLDLPIAPACPAS